MDASNQQARQNTKVKRVLVLGATGGTGRHIVKSARAKGYEVSVLIRSAEKANDFAGSTVIVGDASDENALRNALRGVDAVISSLGTPPSPFKEVTFLSTVTRSLVSAMQVENVTRLICITGIGAGESRGHGGFLFDNLIFPLLLKNVYADKNRQEDVVKNSKLDWVLVRPTVLNDKPGGKAVRALTDLSAFHGGNISREDLADFVVEQLAANTWLRQTPLITN